MRWYEGQTSTATTNIRLNFITQAGERNVFYTDRPTAQAAFDAFKTGSPTTDADSHTPS